MLRNADSGQNQIQHQHQQLAAGSWRSSTSGGQISGTEHNHDDGSGLLLLLLLPLLPLHSTMAPEASQVSVSLYRGYWRYYCMASITARLHACQVPGLKPRIEPKREERDTNGEAEGAEEEKHCRIRLSLSPVLPPGGQASSAIISFQRREGCERAQSITNKMVLLSNGADYGGASGGGEEPAAYSPRISNPPLSVWSRAATFLSPFDSYTFFLMLGRI